MPYTTQKIVRPVDDPRPGDGPYGTRGWKHPEVPAGFEFKAIRGEQHGDKYWVLSDEKGTTDSSGVYRAEKWYLLHEGMYQNVDDKWVGGQNAGWIKPVVAWNGGPVDPPSMSDVPTLIDVGVSVKTIIRFFWSLKP